MLLLSKHVRFTKKKLARAYLRSTVGRTIGKQSAKKIVLPVLKGINAKRLPPRVTTKGPVKKPLGGKRAADTGFSP